MNNTSSLSTYYIPDSVQGTEVEEREAKILVTIDNHLDSVPLLCYPALNHTETEQNPECPHTSTKALLCSSSFVEKLVFLAS